MRKVLFFLFVLLIAAVVGGALYLENIDLKPYRPQVAEQASAALGRRVAIGGDIELRVLTLSPAVFVDDVTIANAGWGSRPEMARVKRLEAEISLLDILTGTLAFRRIVVVEPDLLLETDDSGTGNWVFGAAEDSAPTSQSDGLPVELSINNVRIEDAKLTYRDGETGRVNNARVDRILATATGGSDPVNLDFVGAWNGIPVDVRAGLGRLDRLIGSSGPVAVRLDAKVGNSELSGEGEIDFASVPMRVRLDLVSPWLAIDELVASESAEPASGKLFDSEPLPLSALHAVDAEIKASVQRWTGVIGHLHDVDITLVVRDGRMELSPVTATLGEARLAAAVTLEDSEGTGRLAASVDVKKANLGVIVREVTGSPSLTGFIDIDLDLAGQGLSVAEIMGSADGRLTAVSGRGRVQNEFFTFLSSAALDAVTPWAPKKNPQEVLCFVTRMDIAKGRARSRVTVLDTARATVVGYGGINLGSEYIGMLFTPSTKDTSLLSVAALVPVSVTGPLTNPSAAPDVERAATDVAKNVVGGVIDTAKDVGSLVGLGSGSGSKGSPCGRAMAVAGAERPAAVPAAAGGTETPATNTAPATGGTRKRGTLDEVGSGAEKVIKGIGKGIKGIFD